MSEIKVNYYLRCNKICMDKMFDKDNMGRTHLRWRMEIKKYGYPFVNNGVCFMFMSCRHQKWCFYNWVNNLVGQDHFMTPFNEN